MNILSGKGRINRVQFLIWMLGIFSIVGLIAILGGFDGVHSDDEVVFGWILLLVIYVLSWAPMVRRLHDVNQSQVAYWVAMLIPGGYAVAFIYLLLRKGVQESNRYAKESEFNWFGLDKKTAISSSDNDTFYQQAYEELENRQMDKVLWAKIFAQCNGNENKAKAQYITVRVERLATEQSVLSSQPVTMSPDDQKKRNIESVAKAKSYLALPADCGWPGAMNATPETTFLFTNGFPDNEAAKNLLLNLEKKNLRELDVGGRSINVGDMKTPAFYG